MSRYLMYVLDAEHQPVPIDDHDLWAQWFETAPDRIVRRDQVGDVLVSTVFLGIAHPASTNPSGSSPPLLFETMMFVHGQPQDGAVRTATWDQAREAHRIVLEDAKAVIAEEEAHLVKTFAGARMEAIAAWKARKRGSERN